MVLGAVEGTTVEEGSLLGVREGVLEIEGWTLGSIDGMVDGAIDGILLGDEIGANVGLDDG